MKIPLLLILLFYGLSSSGQKKQVCFTFDDLPNVRQAIDQVQPFGLDLCSGVRTKGQLDPYKLEIFFNHVNATF